jgi:hypothetical protein
MIPWMKKVIFGWISLSTVYERLFKTFTTMGLPEENQR